MKIPVTPAVRRFNRAVERADDLLDGLGDRLDVAQLVEQLAVRNFWSSECGRAGAELYDAARACGYQLNETDKQTN